MHATFILKIAYLGTIVGGLQNKEGGIRELSMGKDSITKLFVICSRTYIDL